MIWSSLEKRVKWARARDPQGIDLLLPNPVYWNILSSDRRCPYMSDFSQDALGALSGVNTCQDSGDFA